MKSKQSLFLLFISLFLFFGSVCGEEYQYTVTEGKSDKTLICFHGMGGSFRMAKILRKQLPFKETLVSFNFPDHGIRGDFDPVKTSFGTPEELIPAFFALKKCIVEGNLDTVDLYGFSAGGGALINVLGKLNTASGEELKTFGISSEDREKILHAVQRGRILLDSPLKSIEEIIDFRGKDPFLELVCARYKENGLSPIESVDNLKGLSLQILLYFETPDEILSNRDDLLFFEKLKAAHVGTTVLFTGNEGGHNFIHHPLWRSYFNASR
jgi:hypothetical protein